MSLGKGNKERQRKKERTNGNNKKWQLRVLNENVGTIIIEYET